MCATEEPRREPRFDIGDIFRAHADEYLRRCRPTAAQLRVMGDIIDCRTDALGGHACVCASCGHTDIAYNSCRNRHCPKCQASAQARWLEAREARILPVPYYHVVFTLPAELRLVAMRHPRAVYGMLFKAASATLIELGRDPKRLGGALGVTAVLHTWRRDLRYHPHLHCVVTGGALSDDRERWVPSPDGFLFPVQVMSKLFRGKFMAAFETAWRDGRLRLDDDDPLTFARLRDRLFGKAWVVYSKRPLAGPEQVVAYLGRYTHRVGISNHRIEDITPTAAVRLLGHPVRRERPPESGWVRLMRALGVHPVGCPSCGEQALIPADSAPAYAIARAPPPSGGAA